MKEQHSQVYKKTFARPGLVYTSKISEKEIQNPKNHCNIIVTCTSTAVPLELRLTTDMSINGKAHKLWRKQRNNTESPGIDFETRKKALQTTLPPSKSKYAGMRSHRVCWHYGKEGHCRSQCHKLKRLTIMKGSPTDLYLRSKHLKDFQNRLPNLRLIYLTQITLLNLLMLLLNLTSPSLSRWSKPNSSLAGRCDEESLVYRQCMLEVHDRRQGLVHLTLEVLQKIHNL